MILSRMITIGFLGSIFAMFRFAKYCRLLNSGMDIEPKKAERYQAKAQRWLAAAGCFLGMVALSIIVVIILQALW